MEVVEISNFEIYNFEELSLDTMHLKLFVF